MRRQLRFITSSHGAAIHQSSGQGRNFGQSGRDEYYGSDSYESGPHGGLGPRGYRRSDERIREDVCECLTNDIWVDASNIDVAVKDCEVTLTGTVTSRDGRTR